ncbi:hypothetical protein G4B88_006616 [Cannabis sativa]|uniref:Uncharacterized protein n=1 Tax=Cannabis sativa TaxID=3483 RepID=A0A7J6GGE9_CANSA|nr:hypothetical protein G4B88_006616 [Cannabis sativa]
MKQDSESEQVKPESPSSVKTKIFRLFGRQRPVHQVFGGGKRKDLFHYFYLFSFFNPDLLCLLASFLGSVIAAWIFFELLELIPSTYSCLSHLDCCTWSLVVSALTIEINRGFAVLRDIASGKDLKKFLMIIHLLCSQEFDMRRDSTSKGLVRWGETHYSNHRFPMVDSFHEHLTVFEAVPLAKPLDNIGLKIDTPPAAPEKDKLIVLYWLIRLKEI